MRWIKLDTALLHSAQLRRFSEVLGISHVAALGHLAALWTSAAAERPEGDIGELGDAWIARAAHWDGDVGAFRGALESAGLLEAQGRLAEWDEQPLRAHALRMRRRRAEDVRHGVTHSVRHAVRHGASPCVTVRNTTRGFSQTIDAQELKQDATTETHSCDARRDARRKQAKVPLSARKIGPISAENPSSAPSHYEPCEVLSEYVINTRDSSYRNINPSALANVRVHTGKSALHEGSVRSVKKQQNAARCNSATAGRKAACARRSKPRIDPADILLEFPARDGSRWPLTRQRLRELVERFPDLDVPRELRRALAWIEGNPSRRKTRRGYSRFITSWLLRADERLGPPRITDDDALVREYAGADALAEVQARRLRGGERKKPQEDDR